ncbi:hypothetical protein N7462_010252 [Penicillium macrosclerotiorum]|uniref:uncharacterized protein n=1 Tax=Penicillium macrosclerotiorum TaxID=303699 RepID=UPI0025490BB5|nr:uncharacterized protein N7462_010252 [Penicillium macrosclerotiorum]KAJ5669182.1 hypothetical protein N7462_010252 [Penicillium macrosclerotiorum]
MSSSPPSPSSGLNVIALISGGKDSLYSILHCIRNGHNVVALANLHPSEPPSTTSSDTTSEADDDIDSFMYQTIGHAVIPLYESALKLPLYRAPITGAAVDTARVYRHNAADQAAQSTEEDETESLVPLLRRVMHDHPHANAVSAGAILSTYQRTRIENVAARLGLVPLAWLWMYPSLPVPEDRRADPGAVSDAGLLEDMAACGCDARIIKVASGGLDDGYLWENVSEAGNSGRMWRRRVVKAMGRFAAPEDTRGAVLGEGAMEGREVRTGEGGVAYMRLTGATCVPKDGDAQEYTPQDVPRPGLVDEMFQDAWEELRSSAVLPGSSGSMAPRLMTPEWTSCMPHHRLSSSTWIISNLVAPEAGPSAADQMRAIADKIQHALRSSNDTHPSPRSTDDIVFTTVLLRSMSDFAPMNTVYVSLFKKPNPPARVTVACGNALPANVTVMVSLTIDRGARDHRSGLHVQSRSYWAPANIGPYSQAITVPQRGPSSIVHIAGQIPLDPASMDVAAPQGYPHEDFIFRAVLALQHLWRIGAATQVDWWLGAVAFLAGGDVGARARVAWALWSKAHAAPVSNDDDNDDEPQLDAWDIKYGRRGADLVPRSSGHGVPRFEVLDRASAFVSPFLAVEVDALPRGCEIEWQGLGSRCARAMVESSADAVSVIVDEGIRSVCVEIGEGSTALAEQVSAVVETYTSGGTLAQAVLYTAQAVDEGVWPGQIVPCRSVWGREGRKLTAAVVLQVENE